MFQSRTLHKLDRLFADLEARIDELEDENAELRVESAERLDLALRATETSSNYLLKTIVAGGFDHLKKETPIDG